MQITISFPKNSKLHVEENTSVKLDDPFYSVGTDKTHDIQVAEMLHIKPADIFKYAKVSVHDTISSGDIIAEKKSLLKKNVVKAPIDGVISAIDHEEGVISISSENDSEQITPTFFAGEINTLDLENNTINITLPNGFAFDVQSIDNDCGGKVSFIEEKDTFTLDADDVAGNILITKHVHPHIEAKADTLGASGIVYCSGNPDSNVTCVAITEDTLQVLQEKVVHMWFSQLTMLKAMDMH